MGAALKDLLGRRLPGRRAFAAIRPPVTAAGVALALAGLATGAGAAGAAGAQAAQAAPAAPAATASCSVSSLVSAITAANAASGGGAVSLTSGCTYTLTAAGNTTDGGTGLPVITGHVTIQGNGAVITRSGASGTPSFRLLDVASTGSLALSSLTLSNGLADTGVGGGAIFSHGTLNVSGSRFSGNSSPATTGPSGGAIDSAGTLTVTTSSFGNNTAQEGGGILNQSSATISSTTFTGNTGTVYGGGGLVNAAGTMTLTGDTFSGNSAPGSAGGGAIDNDATVHISDSTFAGNTGGTNGGGAIQNFGSMTMTEVTLSANSSPYGADIHNVPVAGGTLSVSMSIVANGLQGSNCSGSAPISDGGYNLDSGSSCGFAAASGSRSNANPQLGALASNGGPTQTMALPAGSPARNAVPFSVHGCLGSTDQRGVIRPQAVGCDIGAYELAMPGGAVTGYGGKCLDDSNFGTGNGNKIDIFGCNKTGEQKWVFASNGELQVLGKCLDDTGWGGQGTWMELYTCNGGTNQQWTHLSNGDYVLKYNGLCLDDPAWVTLNGTRVDIWRCNGGANQHWSLPA